MMDSEEMRELESYVDKAVGRVEIAVSREFARMEGLLSAHQADAWAHGPARAAGEAQLRDWMAWRVSVDRWRWMLTGAVALIGFESTAVGLVAGVLALVHH